MAQGSVWMSQEPGKADRIQASLVQIWQPLASTISDFSLLAI